MVSLKRLAPAVALAAMVIAIWLPAPASAAPIAYQIDLTVTNNANNAFGVVGTGAMFSATVDLDPTISFGAVGNATNFFLDLNGTIFQTNPTLPGGAALTFHGANTSGSAPAPFAADDPNGFVDYLLRINMTASTSGPTNAAFSGLAISGSSANDITWGAYDAATGFALTGLFTIQLAIDTDPGAVVAPATLALFGLGLAVLGFSRRRAA